MSKLLSSLSSLPILGTRPITEIQSNLKNLGIRNNSTNKKALQRRLNDEVAKLKREMNAVGAQYNEKGKPIYLKQRVNGLKQYFTNQTRKLGIPKNTVNAVSDSLASIKGLVNTRVNELGDILRGLGYHPDDDMNEDIEQLLAPHMKAFEKHPNIVNEQFLRRLRNNIREKLYEEAVFRNIPFQKLLKESRHTCTVDLIKETLDNKEAVLADILTQPENERKPVLAAFYKILLHNLSELLALGFVEGNHQWFTPTGEWIAEDRKKRQLSCAKALEKNPLNFKRYVRSGGRSRPYKQRRFTRRR